MKQLTLASVLVVLISLVMMSCGSRDESKKQNANSEVPKSDRIKVGMTYDEVEKLLGRPNQIIRGSNQLERGFLLGDLDADGRQIDFMRTAADTAKARNVWPYPQIVETVGQLIYVNWVFSDLSLDTNYVWVRKYVTKTETSRVPGTYVVNGIEASKETFDNIKEGELVYPTYSGRYVSSKSIWEQEKRQHPYDMPEPKPAKKQIWLADKQRQVIVPQEPTKKSFVVTKFFCVTFDASSGRVVQAGFQPFFVNEMK